jgi:KAP family P-loop domain
MADAETISRTLSKLKTGFRLSSPVMRVLERARTRKVISVASFLEAAASGTERDARTAGSVLQKYFGPAEPGAFDQLFGERISDPAGDPEVSAGLWEAFQEATNMRRHTGGQDNFLGLRHILFVIFTAREGPLAQETEKVLQAIRVDPQLVTEIAKYCVEHREREESVKAWEEILKPLNLASLLLVGADPSIPREEVGSALRKPPNPNEDTFSASVVPDRSKPWTPRPGPRDAEIALLQPDDPWASDVQDRTGAKSEAEAFASMVTARQFQPPLAVGIFGDWGSGKSFFMRLLYDAIKARRRSSDHPTDGDVTFYNDVVQIRFNAWHYAETNLWASLVEHIFTSLNSWAEAKASGTAADRLFDGLATARRLTIEAAETLVQRKRERSDAAERLSTAEKELAQQRELVERAPATYASAAFSAIIGNQEVKAKLNEAAQDLGLAKLSDNVADLKAVGSALDGEISRYALLQFGIMRKIASPITVGCIAVATVALPTLFVWVGRWWDNTGTELGGAIAGLVAPLVVAFGWAVHQAERALGVVRGFRTEFDKEVERQTAQDATNVAAQDKALATAEAKAREAAEELRMANEKAAAAARDYYGDSGRERVLRFVRARLAEGDYAKHLTFIATIRKDFEEFSRLMTANPDQKAKADAEAARKAHESRVEQFIKQNADVLELSEQVQMRKTFALEATPPVVFERIVLYIDDLDRCPADKVVTVLEAIHLLLTFPLFVVFVAVDVRWLRGSLVSEYSGQLSDKVGENKATASDYLEKIFQIPYWVRPMGLENTQAILRDCMGPEEPERPAPKQDMTSRAYGPENPETAQAEIELGVLRARASGDTREEKKQDEEELRAVSLKFTQSERRFMNDMAAILDGLPRRTLRFINTYRVIKGSLGGAELDYLEERGFRALITLLAVGIIADDDFPRLVKVLGTWPKSNEPLDINAVLESSPIEPSSSKDRVKRGLELAKGVTGADFARYATLAARFSFHEGLRTRLRA